MKKIAYLLRIYNTYLFFIMNFVYNLLLLSQKCSFEIQATYNYYYHHVIGPWAVELGTSEVQQDYVLGDLLYQSKAKFSELYFITIHKFLST
jgi:hypothetical protein